MSVLAFVFNRPYAQVIIDASGGTTGGAISSPISNSVSSVGNTTTGASTSSSQGGTGGLGGSSTSSGGSSNAVGGRSSSSGNTSGNSSVVSNYAAPKIPVSTAYSPTNFPTAPCMGATSLGASGVMFGLSAGSSWEATECMRLELARSFEQSGHIEDAQAVRCSSKYAVDAPSCIRLRQEKVNGNKQAVPILEPQVLPVDSQRPQSTKFIEGAYFETIDPETGFQTIIDTRDFYRRIATP